MAQQSKRVIFTGQSGLGKRSLLEELKNCAESQGRNAQLFSIGRMMYEITKAESGRILKLPLDRIELARSQAFHKIRDFIDQNPGSDVYIDTHATFRWEDGLFSGFSVQEMKQLAPDLCICFVADVDQVKLGLDNADFPLPLSLRDILFWREEEMLCSSLIAEIATCTQYVVPRRFRVEALFRLIYETDRRKLYISFPISRIPSELMRGEIEAFRKEFHALENCVIFDPMEVTEEPRLISALDKAISEDHEVQFIEVPSQDQLVKLSVRELQDIRGYVDSRTRSFDYRMIGQSDAVVAFVPEHEGSPYTAEGVTMEIAYALLVKAKPVYVVWPAGKKPSLMINPEKVFSNVEEAVSFFSA